MSYRRYPQKIPHLGWVWLVILILLAALAWRILFGF